MAINKIDDYRFVEIVRTELENKIHKFVEDQIVKAELKKFEEKLRPLVKETVEKVTLEGVNRMADFHEIAIQIQYAMKDMEGNQ